jgi:hypothetical protein
MSQGMVAWWRRRRLRAARLHARQCLECGALTTVAGTDVCRACLLGRDRQQEMVRR